MKRPKDVQRLFVYFVHAREEARLNKELGFWPHSEDPILQEFKFCNINREHDRVTRWIDENIRQVDCSHIQMVQSLAVARVFNEPHILEHIIPLRGIERLHFRVLKLQEEKVVRKVFRGAYMMPVHGAAGKGKSAIEYWCNNIAKLKKCEQQSTLHDVARLIKTMPAFGAFLTNQVVADLRYTRFYPKDTTTDWETYAEAGPGTTRGVRRFFQLEPFGDTPSKALKVTNLTMQKIRALLEPDCDPEINEYFLDLNNLCNAFCEFDKFCRATEISPDDFKHRVALRRYTPTTQP